MLDYVPEHIKAAAFKECGETLEGAAEAIWQFNKAIVDATYDLIPAVKPQIAMYEQFGTEGVKAYQKTVDYCHSKDLVVIGDVKRGDIGSTSAAYAVGHLGKVQVGSKKLSAFDEDFATVNPYLGSDGIKPFLEVCKEEKKGIFILVKTSNPSSGEFQDRLIDGRPLYEYVGEKVAQWGEEVMGDNYSYVGAVVGATYPEIGKVLRKVMPKSFILVPGYGAQGGKGADLVHYFDENGLGAIVNSSRGIIAAYKQEAYASFGAEHFADASRAAVEAMIKDIDGAYRQDRRRRWQRSLKNRRLLSARKKLRMTFTVCGCVRKRLQRMQKQVSLYLYIVMKEAGCFQDQSVSVKLIKRIMPSVWYTVKLEREQKSFPVCIPAEFLI